MPRRRTTCRTFWARTPDIAVRRSWSRAVAGALAAALAWVAPVIVPAASDAAPSVTTILAAYDRATHDDDLPAFQTAGTLSGDGLRGSFHSWHDGRNERDDESLGPRSEMTLQLGSRMFVRNANGNVRELTGYMRRRALTAQFVETGAFINEPERAHYLGTAKLGDATMWKLDVCADGGEPETLWIDTTTGLLARVEYLDGDGPSTIDFSDYRSVNGHVFPFRMVTSDGDHQFDVVSQTTSVTLGGEIARDVFAVPPNRTLIAHAAQVVPLVDLDGHIGCRVTIDGKPYAFLLDTGAQSVLLDSSVARAAGLREEGALEVRGATRSGGLHLVQLPHLQIGTATLDDLVATSLDLSNVLGSTTKLDGILGFPFFASSLVEVDFARRTMRFGPPGAFLPQGQKIDLDLDRGMVEARAQLDGSLDAPFIIDTGNSGELLLYRPFITAHPGIVPLARQPIANYGIGGSTPTYRSTLESFALGAYPLYHRVADVVMAEQGAFADRVDAGNIGLGILKNFIVTFDLANDALYLQTGSAFDDGRLRMAINPQ